MDLHILLSMPVSEGGNRRNKLQDMSKTMFAGNCEAGQIAQAEPAGLPNGVSSNLRPRAKQKQQLHGKWNGILPQAGKKGLRSRAVSKQSAAWDKFTAESPETLTESTTAVDTSTQAADICRPAGQNQEAADELNKSREAVDAAQEVDPPARPSQSTAAISSSNGMVEASQPESRDGRNISAVATVWPHNEPLKESDGSSGLFNAEGQGPPNLHMLQEGIFLPALEQAPLHRAPEASARYVFFLQLSNPFMD